MLNRPLSLQFHTALRTGLTWSTDTHTYVANATDLKVSIAAFNRDIWAEKDSALSIQLMGNKELVEFLKGVREKLKERVARIGVKSDNLIV